MAAARASAAELLLHGEAAPPALVAHLLARQKVAESIGRILVQMPPGERKSGMPHSVEMPAPVNGTTVRGLGRSVSAAVPLPVSRSGRDHTIWSSMAAGAPAADVK